MIVTITGHRPDKLGGYTIPNPVYEAVKEGLRTSLQTLKAELVITGMALGTDQWAAEVCIEEGIKFLAAVPFEGQEGKWPPAAQDRYKQLLQKAAHIYVISKGGYEPNKMHVRNRWMVKSCDVVLAVFDGSVGGTSACIAAAHAAEKKLVKVELTNDIWAMAKAIKEKRDYTQAIKKEMMNPAYEKAAVSSFVSQMKEKSVAVSVTLGAKAKANEVALLQALEMEALIEQEKAKATYLKEKLDELKEKNTKLQDAITTPVMVPSKKYANLPKYKKPIKLSDPIEEFEEEPAPKSNPLSIQGFKRKLNLDE